MSTDSQTQSMDFARKSTWPKGLFSRSVAIEVAGGLGNQLFSLVAGIYISKQLGVPLKVFINDVLSSSTIAGQGLRSFRFFTSKSSLIESIEYRPSRMLRFRQRLNSRLRRVGLGKVASDSLSGYYSPLLVGDDSNIGLIKAGTFIQGYFQSARYFLDLKNSADFQGFEIINPTSWFLGMAQEAEKVKPIAVHIRRGDYLKPENNFIGALSKTFFLGAISLLKQDPLYKDSEVWIFSNDIPMVQTELGNDLESVVRWIEPPSNSSEAESMLLMAKSRGLVMSNSTFSWWSAAIGEPDRVIAPSKWFKGADDPQGLMIPSWERVESSWI